MDMSKAALPPRSGYYTPADEAHSRFREYRAYQSSRARLMIDCEDFRVWLAATERNEALDAEADHPRFKEWQAWFIANRKGAQPLPNGGPSAFPFNFRYWLTNGAY